MNKEICWKHTRQTNKNGHCSECNGSPPDRPKAYSNSIKNASIALSYAFGDIRNEGMRQSIAESWEYKLRELIKQQNYNIVEVQ